ncbi:MAG: hypothetical protein DRJ52_00205 [Thermoprotei archaeon]|nr:MAG: hypothetical protein DRJ52_00205 [Thermoprotei archaeon]
MLPIYRENMSKKRIVTLLDETQAKPGYRFVIYSIPDKCKKCKLYKACLSKLRPGRTYRVVSVRKKKHICPLTNREVVVVKVVEEPMYIALPSSKAIEGVTMTYREDLASCPSKVYCRYRKYCDPSPGIVKGTKVKINKLISKIKCMRGLDLVLVEVDVLK